MKGDDDRVTIFFKKQYLRFLDVVLKCTVSLQ